MSSVFNTPRNTSNSDTSLLEMIRMKKNRRNNVQSLTEAAVTEAESAETLKKMEAIDAEDAAQKEMDDKNDDRRARVAKEAASRALIRLESRLNTEGCQKAFNETIFEMAYNACWIDNCVKENNVVPMYETFNNVINILRENGIAVNMESDVTPFIKNIREAVSEACCKSTKRIVETTCNSGKDCAKDIDSINFEMNEDELNDLASSLSDLGKEDIEELVKNKVLAVVQDERAKGQEKAAEIDAIRKAQDEAIDPEANDDENPANESFNMLVQRSRNMKAHRKTGTSLFECMMMYNTNQLQKEASALESTVTNDQIMNAALQETVLVYTIMETLNTLGLCEFNNINVNKLCDYYRIGLK